MVYLPEYESTWWRNVLISCSALLSAANPQYCVSVSPFTSTEKNRSQNIFFFTRARGDSISSTYDTFVPSQSPGLQQLIELQERVKGGSLTMDEALERFSDWQRVQKGMDSIQQVAHGASLSQHRAADSIIQRIRSFKLTLAHPSGSHIGVTNILHFSVDIRSLVF
uniref:B cell scaffold protein with ankyrin repeats 1 n=1 Tax=Myripristis murdjan TaxID=586833 RepID=A0A667Z9E0_9TELE